MKLTRLHLLLQLPVKTHFFKLSTNLFSITALVVIGNSSNTSNNAYFIGLIFVTGAPI